MSEYSAAELAAQVNDPECDYVGPYLKPLRGGVRPY
jgi:hypothetical protein